VYVYESFERGLWTGGPGLCAVAVCAPAALTRQ